MGGRAITFKCTEHRLHLTDMYVDFSATANGEHIIQVSNRLSGTYSDNNDQALLRLLLLLLLRLILSQNVLMRPTGHRRRPLLCVSNSVQQRHTPSNDLAKLPPARGLATRCRAKWEDAQLCQELLEKGPPRLVQARTDMAHYSKKVELEGSGAKVFVRPEQYAPHTP